MKLAKLAVLTALMTTCGLAQNFEGGNGIAGAGGFSFTIPASAVTVATPVTNATLTTAFNAAGNDGWVKIPAGTWTVSSCMAIPAHRNITGAGLGTVILKRPSNGNWCTFYFADGYNHLENLVFDGGSVEGYGGSTSTDPDGYNTHIEIHNTTFKNYANTQYYVGALYQSRGWKSVDFTYNSFSNIVSSLGIGYDANPAVRDDFPGTGIWSQSYGNDVHIGFNTFDYIAYNAIKGWFEQPHARGRATGNRFNYNMMHHVHRIGIELQHCNTSQCVSNSSNDATRIGSADGLQVWGNQFDEAWAPDQLTFGLSLPVDWQLNGSYYSNSVIGDSKCCSYDGGNYGYGLEVSGIGTIVKFNRIIGQSQKLDSHTPSTVAWGTYLALDRSTNNPVENNYLCGNDAVANGIIQGVDGGATNNPVLYNSVKNGACPFDPNFLTTSMTIATTTTNNQTISAGSTLPLSYWVVSLPMAVKYVRWYLDGSATEFASQVIPNQNTSFASDMKNLYTTALVTAGLSSGSHTVVMKATDTQNGVVSSSPLTFTIYGGGPPPPITPGQNGAAATKLTWLHSDDFSDKDPNPWWTKQDTKGGSTYSVANGKLFINVPGGNGNYDPYTNGNEGINFFQELGGTGDFEVTAKFDQVTGDGQTQGIMLQQDTTHFLRCDVVMNAGGNQAFSVYINGDTPENYYIDGTLPAPSSYWTRLKRTGNHYACYTSTDNLTYYLETEYDSAIVPTKVGVWAGDLGVAFTSIVDYFRVTGQDFNPISTLPKMISVSGSDVIKVNGNLTVTQN